MFYFLFLRLNFFFHFYIFQVFFLQKYGLVAKVVANVVLVAKVVAWVVTSCLGDCFSGC